VRWYYAGYTGRTAETTMLETPERANAQFTTPRTSAYKDILMAKSLYRRRRAELSRRFLTFPRFQRIASIVLSISSVARLLHAYGIGRAEPTDQAKAISHMEPE
jgi:hypothetical protein